MAVTLDSTVGGTAANSFASLAEADAYFANHPYATNFTTKTEDQRESYLIAATQRIAQESFLGWRTANTQALPFPRSGIDVPNEPYGGYLDADTIPAQIKIAQYELALVIAGSDIFAPTGLENYKSVSVGPIAVEFNQPVSSGLIPDQVLRLLRGLRLNASGSALVRA